MRINISFIYRLLENRTIATFVLVLFCVRIFALEGFDISPIKVGVMAMMPVLLLFQTRIATRTMLLVILYWGVCFFTAVYNQQMRFSTLGFLAMFLLTFTYYEASLRKGVFTLPYFVRLLRFLILAFGVVLIAQQACLLVGLRTVPFLNLMGQHYLAIDKLPSLSYEPSSTARILAVAYLCYLRCLQIVYGTKPSIMQLFKGSNKWCTLLFLWTMLMIGSGTAFICLGILSLYFVSLRNAILTIPFFIGMFVVAENMGMKQLERASKAVEISTKLDASKIVEEDNSAAVRIAPLINTLTKTDLTDSKTWLGEGTSEKGRITAKGILEAKHGVLTQYGLVALILSLCIAYSSIICGFWSVENFLFLIIFLGGIGNIDYAWGAYMLFAGGKYFMDRHHRKNIPTHEYNEVKSLLSQA